MTSTYCERASRVPGAIVWTATSGPGTKRVVPDGCMDLIWNGREVIVAGPDTHAQLFGDAGTTTMVGLRFAPGYAPRVLGQPALGFVDQRVPLDLVWSRADVDRVVEELNTNAGAGRVLERVAQRAAPPPDPETQRIDAVAALARRGESVSTIAATVGWSTRQLQRRCRDAFGYGAKTLERILRFGHALELAYDGTDFARTAAWSGYADQSHLAREVKDLAGVPLGQLVAGGDTANSSTSLPSGSYTAA